MKHIFCVILFSSFFSTFAQTMDAQLWENIYLEKRITNDWNVHLNHEGRVSNNIDQFHYAYLDFGVTRKLTKHFKLSADYVPIWKLTTKRESIRHQWYIDLATKYKFKPVELEWRFMFQQQVQDIHSSDFGYIPDNYLRNKFTAKFILEKYPWYRYTPYLAYELYYRLSEFGGFGKQADRNRYFAGVFYNFNKRTSIEFYYMIEQHYNINDPPTNFVTGIGFSHEL